MAYEVAARFINSDLLKPVNQSWLEPVKYQSSGKKVLICNDTDVKWKFWVGDQWTKDIGLRWLDPGCFYEHQFTAHHFLFWNTNILSRIYSPQHDTYAGFSVYGDGVPRKDNLLLIKSDGVFYWDSERNNWFKICGIQNNGSDGDTGLYEVERMKKES